jgi:cysteine-S-conjugate beta-lyase
MTFVPLNAQHNFILKKIIMYDFDKIISRHDTNSVKWDLRPNMLPMWVADMDFETAPAVKAAVLHRAEHGIFGYVHVPEAYYNAVIQWFKRRHHWQMQKEWIVYTTGVVPAISAIIKAMTEPGDGVLIQTPVYNCFFSSIKNNGCRVIENELVYHDQTYTIDFEDLERKASDSSVKVMILCNPHNPAGRVWTREDLQHIGEICFRNNVFVIADEIHCELVMPGYKYTPFASISEEFEKHSATCTSPSKSFNIAGLQIANITISDETIRRRIDRTINVNEVCDVNPFGVDALIAAYNESEDWLNQLNIYINSNYQYLCNFFTNNLPKFPVTKLEGTYLVWIDISILDKSSKVVTKELLNKENIWLNEGIMYGTSGDKFVRINIACPRDTLNEGLVRLKRAWG